MATREGIYVGGHEIVERYVGDKLVWSKWIRIGTVRSINRARGFISTVASMDVNDSSRFINHPRYGRGKTKKVKIIDDNNIITIAHSGQNIFEKIEGYKYFSIVPIYKNTKMTIKNSKYEVENLILTLNRPNATSNEFANEKAIELEVSSNVLVIYSKD